MPGQKACSALPPRYASAPADETPRPHDAHALAHHLRQPRLQLRQRLSAQEWLPRPVLALADSLPSARGLTVLELTVWHRHRRTFGHRWHRRGLRLGLRLLQIARRRHGRHPTRRRRWHHRPGLIAGITLRHVAGMRRLCVARRRSIPGRWRVALRHVARRHLLRRIPISLWRHVAGRISSVTLRRIRIPRWIARRRITRRILSRLLLLRRRHLTALRRNRIGLGTRWLLLGIHNSLGLWPLVVLILCFGRSKTTQNKVYASR